MEEAQIAWQAIQDGDLIRAQRLAADLAKKDPDNAAAWYILSEAVGGERGELFRRKALALDSDVADQFAPTEFVDEFHGLEDQIDSDFETPDMMAHVDDELVPGQVELSPDYYEPVMPVPTIEPEMESKQTDNALPAAVASANERTSTQKRMPSSEKESTNMGVINILLFIVGALMLVVLYFLINSLL